MASSSHIYIPTLVFVFFTQFLANHQAYAHCDWCDGDNFEPITVTNQLMSCADIGSDKSECRQYRSIRNRCCRTCDEYLDCDDDRNENSGDNNNSGENSGGGSSGESGGCFPGESTVITATGSMRIDEMSLDNSGDTRVLAMDGNSQLALQPVILWLHRSEGEMNYLMISTDGGHMIRASKTHYLFTTPCQAPGSTKTPKFARDVKIGECMLVHSNSTLTKNRVLGIQEKHLPGKYQFTTISGTVVVDGVLASTYSIVDNYGLQELAYAGLHKLNTVLALVPDRLKRLVSYDGLEPISEVLWSVFDSSSVL